MWLDDDGDEPIGGEIPDPSTRQWRHPSEIAAEAARAAAESPLVPEAAMLDVSRTPVSVGSSASILWPITVVGGCIAVAALGVFGLYLTGAAPETELQVASATTVNPGSGGLSSLARQSAAPENRVADEDVANPDGSSDSDSDGTDRPDTDGSASDYGDDNDSSEDNDGTPLRSLDADGGPLSTTSTTSRADATSTLTTPRPSSTLVQPDQLAPVGPAVYPVNGSDGSSLASVVLVEGYLVTSASAISGHDEVRLQIGRIEAVAVVSHVDALSDVALLDTTDPLVLQSLPAAIVGPPVTPGVKVFLGYCAKDMPSESLTTAWRQTDDDALPAPVSQLGCSPPPASDVAAGDLGALDTEEEQFARQPATPDGEQLPTTTTTTTPAQSDEKRRGGKVYSLDQTLLTSAGRLVYNPIRTGIPQVATVAGAPLRNAEGQLVGLVVPSASPNISALPISRVLAVAESLTATGLGSPAWLGIDVQSTPSGVEVLAVTEGGPSDGLLQVGDVIDRAAGEMLNEADHLEYLTRRVGPGLPLQVRLNRAGKRTWATITVGTAPTN